eukprot:3938644-Rhodomonas_salina.2
MDCDDDNDNDSGHGYAGEAFTYPTLSENRHSDRAETRLGGVVDADIEQHAGYGLTHATLRA